MKVQRLISLVVISSYLLKSTIKLISGSLLSIPILIADGIHGLFDIIEHGFLVTAGHYARKQNRERYPIDRQPLIDLVGLIIFAGLIFFGTILIWESIKLLLTSMLAFQWFTYSFPEWILSVEITKEFTFPGQIFVASLILLGSYIISESVYQFQYKLANKHRIREMIADAKELRSDGWLELGTGISLLFSWILIQLFSGRIDVMNLSGIISMINSIVLFFLGGYLIFVAWPEFWGNFNNLMNKALDKDKRILLEKSLDKRIPIGCKIIQPLVCYHRGDQLFINGLISIEPSMMSSADIIVRNAELVTKTFFSNSELTIFSQFSPTFRITNDIIDDELKRIISGVFHLPPQSPAGEAFRLLRKGKLDDALKWVLNNETVNIKQKLLSIFICAEVFYRKYGPKDEQTQEAVEKLKQSLITNIENDIRLFVESWLLIFHSDQQSNSKLDEFNIQTIRGRIASSIDHAAMQNDYCLAEACFAMGFSWERCADYNLEFCRDYYRKSEYYYKRGGYRSEIDRLYNTWGHFETLTYSLGDAEMHLDFVSEIREIKKDNLGLTFTYGCLGDLYGRSGNFKLAKEFYDKDIALLKQLNIEHVVPGLTVKMADQLIKEGLLDNDKFLIVRAIDLCEHAAGKLNNPFFAYKGIIKGLLALLNFANNEEEKTRFISKVLEAFDKAVANPPYEKAFWHRLKGRLEGMQGNFSEAQNELAASMTFFDNMKDPVHELTFSIQSIVSGMEAYKWSIFDKRYGYKISTDEPLSVNSLKAYIDLVDGMISGLSGPLKELLADYESAGNNNEKKTKVLDRMIWFLEG